jgi:N-acyl-D-amino-acid deacylase
MKRILLAAAIFAAAFFFVAATPAEVDDLIFENGLVADGTGAPLFAADVAVRGDRIAAVGPLPAERRARARRRIDATGLVLSPGFIDLLGQSEYAVLVDARAASKITQGITTEVTGEGESIAPLNAAMLRDGEAQYAYYGVRPDFTTLAGYFERFRRTPPTINLGTFVGLGGLRKYVIGTEDRRATPAELAAMEREVEAAMKAGALGVSTSLQYVPDMYNSTGEIVAMAKVAARYGGVYFTHQRSEGNQIDASLDEVFRIAREAGIPADVWHLKTASKRNWGRMPHVLTRLEAARAGGLDVAANMYPWTAGSNGLDACLPPWVREGGKEKLVARLADAAVRARVKNEMAEDSDAWSNQWVGSGGAAGVMLSTVLNPALKKYEGKTLEAIGREMGVDPRDAVMDLVVADKANSTCIIFMMSDDDVRAALRSRLVAFCTDSSASATDGILSKEKSHPRACASAARILGTYVRDEKLLPLEEAIRKMTSLPAARARIQDRGLLRPGMKADVVAFSPNAVRAVATYEDPLHYSEGIPYVAVNGQLVVDGGKITSARPGQLVLGPGVGFGRPPAGR